MATNPALETLCRDAAVDDPRPYLVYADWLQKNGDARGERLVAIDRAGGSVAARRLRQKVVVFGWTLEAAVQEVLASPRDWDVYRAFGECLSQHGLFGKEMLERQQRWERSNAAFDDLRRVWWMQGLGWRYAGRLASGFIADRLATIRNARDLQALITECVQLANAGGVEFRIAEEDYETLARYFPSGATRHYIGHNRRNEQGAWVPSLSCLYQEDEAGGWM